jgi:hypothetical protein
MTISIRFLALAMISLAALGCSNDKKDPAPKDDASVDGPGEDAAFVDGDVVINEIQAEGDDWVEIINTGAAAVNLEGFGVTDADDTGAPRIDRAVRFPVGVELGADELFVIVADQPAVSTALETDCLMGAVDECLFADWGISTGDGDTIFILDVENNVVAKTKFPPNAATGGNSWARVPDGVGAFQSAAATPGAPNE